MKFLGIWLVWTGGVITYYGDPLVLSWQKLSSLLLLLIGIVLINNSST